MDTPGSLFVVSAPSGAGKSTLVKLLLECDRRVRHSVSCTTRAPRPGEQDGREYHFVDIPAFCAMRDRGEFIEWAEVHGNFYGTSRVWIESQMQAGCDMLLMRMSTDEPIGPVIPKTGLAPVWWTWSV